MMSKNALWRILIALSIVVMAYADASGSTHSYLHVRVSVWVLLLFVMTAATLFIYVPHPQQHTRDALSAFGWMVGGFFFLYNETWSLTELFRNHLPPENINLFPFGLNATWIVFIGIMLFGLGLMFVCRE
jgi:hypothetical protein